MTIQYTWTLPTLSLKPKPKPEREEGMNEPRAVRNPKSLTYQGLNRAYRKIYRSLEKDLDGGLAFGMDWRTVTMLYPERAKDMKDLLREMGAR